MSDPNDEQSVTEKNSTPSVEEVGLQFNRSHVYIALFVFFGFIGGLASGFLIWGRESAPEIPLVVATQAPDSPQVEGTQEVVRLDISVDDDPALGPADAPITIVEFSDFRCPFCSRFHLETFPSLMASFPNQIRFVYRDFPVVGGFDASLAANCAYEQNAFWEYHDLLLSRELELDASAYQAYAERLNLDTEALAECLESERYSDEIIADAQYASDLGVTGTPTFFINGIPLVGAQPLAAFVQIIESELAD